MHVFMCTVTKVATFTKKECVICFIASNFGTPWNTITNRYIEILSSSKQKDQLKLPEGRFLKRRSCSLTWQNGAMKTQYDKLVGIVLNHFTLGLTS